MLPRSCKLLENVMGTVRMNTNAPHFTKNEAALAIFSSSCSLHDGLMYSRYILRENRLATAIDIIAAGTSAHITIAAKANPANHAGKNLVNSAGTMPLVW